MRNITWLTTAGACCVGTLFGFALQPRQGRASTLTLYGSIAGMEKESGTLPLTFAFKDRTTGRVVATKRGVANIDHGSYSVDLPTDGLRTSEVYAVTALEAPA